MTAADLARGRALRDAERDEPFARRATYAFSDWLDQHADELLALAAQALEPPAQDPRYKHILSGDYYMPGHKNETKE